MPNCRGRGGGGMRVGGEGGGWSNKMLQGEITKTSWNGGRELYIGHSFIMIKRTWGIFSKKSTVVDILIAAQTLNKDSTFLFYF